MASRLVELHVRLDEPVPALAWAARVARRHPEPAAFLAGVYARLGLFTDAEMALRQALREATERRLETLRARQTIKAGPDPAPEQREEHP